MKITLVFEDKPDGKVSITCSPVNAGELMRRFKDGHKMTNAESMVIMALLRAMAESKKKEFEQSRIIV